MGLPIETFAMVIATVLAGSLGMGHYLIVHKLMDKPFPGGDRTKPEEQAAGK
ncbi:hypothetical protein [Halegenticoccus tardaugens]|uniref:hypothetical protein n=1 Tax=Halegenticoccus tardaugens TaxID=2071624 RepID=UPI0013E90166|nr:hypothetical protein [Halegenticoccus tardaugens]